MNRPNVDCLVRVEADKYSATFGSGLRYLYYPILKRTPCGVWITDMPSTHLLSSSFVGRRFVLLTATKKFACETEAEALESFMARKRRQISILHYKLQSAEQDLQLALRLAANQKEDK